MMTNEKKLLSALLLCLVCFFAGSALADEIKPVPDGQISYVLPRGLELAAKVEETDGILNIVIDDDQARWDEAIASTGTGAGDVQLIWQIKAPADVQVGDHVLLSSAEDDQAAIADFAEIEAMNAYKTIGSIDSWGVACEENGMPITERGIGIATSIQELSLLVPVNYEKTVYVRWYDSNKNPNATYGYQKLTIKVTHTQSDAFETKLFNAVDAERITANYSSVSSVSVLEKKSGEVSYCIPVDNTTVQTAVKASNAATHYSLQGNMKSGAASGPQPLTNGSAVIRTTRSGRDTQSGTTTIFFCDENGFILEQVGLNISYQSSEELLVWPAYDRDFYTMDQSRLNIINNAASAGYTISYNESTGLLKCGYNGTMSTGGKPGDVVLQVTAPEWAAACRVYSVGGNNILGATTGSREGMEMALDRSYPDGPVPISAGYIHNERYTPFNIIRPADDSITIYVPDLSASVDHYANLYVFEWIDSIGSSDREYFWQTTDEFTVVEKTIPVTSVKDLKKPVDKPHVVGPNGQPFQNWELIITSYFTEGEDVWHIDLSLVDANGDPVQKTTKPLKVYWPYPEGHAYGDGNIKYKLHHYDKGLYDGSELGKNETLEVTATEYGLLFETSSFSPFILSWEDAVSSGDVSGETETTVSSQGHMALNQRSANPAEPKMT